ncbi:von willebrand factor a domain-containing protein 5a [Anaeramoeba ignava]|uniref:von willebrand factor a domain-containing protein 5a n=1 Tax=Anaeramoeba ignava TaxID=1746090 RepID=A0A9Q0LJ82_ANAIG|nr:von willebrand factor a domain-containing protein 5a [Anaeramoeba ignava]
MVKAGLVNKKTNDLVPLKGISITANIVDFTAEVTINQRYENQEKQPIEAIFVFPLDPDSSICGLEVFMEGKHIVGKVKEKQKARDKYEDAIAQGHTAIKMEKEVDGVFNMNVGNIAPEKQCIVTIRYVTELTATEDKELRFFIPTTITPLFVPKHQEIKDIAPLLETEYTPKVGYGFTLNMNISMASEITEIKSQSHEIKSEINKKFGTITLLTEPDESLSKDFEILIQVTEPHEPRAIIQYKDTENKEREYAALMSFYPDIADKDVQTELLFLIDRSGSMSGTPIRSVSETLDIFLHAIPDTCAFNIIGFGSNYETLFPTSVKYSQESLEKALSHAKNMRANLGGTELLRPLQYIFSNQPMEGYARQVFLLTDGEVYNVDELKNLVRFQSSTTRVFTFGIGSSASRALVKGIAEAGGGQAEFIVNNEDIRPSVMRQLNRALQPAITNVSIEFVNGPKPDVVSPFRLPSIFAESRLLVYALFKKNDPVQAVLNGISSGQKIQWKLDLDPKSNAFEGSAIHALAARKMISEIEEKTSQFHTNDGKIKSEFNQKKLDDKIVELSTNFGVMSSKTSFIAVVKDLERPDDLEKDLGEMVVRKVKVQESQQYQGFSYPTQQSYSGYNQYQGYGQYQAFSNPQSFNAFSYTSNYVQPSYAYPQSTTSGNADMSQLLSSLSARRSVAMDDDDDDGNPFEGNALNDEDEDIFGDDDSDKDNDKVNGKYKYKDKYEDKDEDEDIFGDDDSDEDNDSRKFLQEQEQDMKFEQNERLDENFFDESPQFNTFGGFDTGYAEFESPQMEMDINKAIALSLQEANIPHPTVTESVVQKKARSKKKEFLLQNSKQKLFILLLVLNLLMDLLNRMIIFSLL